MDPRQNPLYMKMFGHVVEDVIDIIDVCKEEDISPLDALTVALLLRELDVRDAILCHAAVEGGEDEEALVRVFNLTTYVITDGVAPIATVLSILLWMREQEDMARIALDIALSDDPEYALANLFYQMIEGFATSPEEVRMLMSVRLLG